VTPEDFPRRSPVYRRLVDAGATFVERYGAAAASTFPGDRSPPPPVGLADLSPLRRLGFKGRGAFAWLNAQGLAVPEANNRTARTGGILVLRLGDNEALVLDAVDTPDPRIESVMAAAAPAKVYPVPRADTHAWFLVTGPAAPELFATLCGVDLRPHRFDDGAIAQTSIARLPSVVAHDDRGGKPAYHVLADWASAHYLWDCLTEAMATFDGRLLGLADLAVAK